MCARTFRPHSLPSSVVPRPDVEVDIFGLVVFVDDAGEVHKGVCAPVASISHRCRFSEPRKKLLGTYTLVMYVLMSSGGIYSVTAVRTPTAATIFPSVKLIEVEGPPHSVRKLLSAGSSGLIL